MAHKEPVKYDISRGCIADPAARLDQGVNTFSSTRNGANTLNNTADPLCRLSMYQLCLYLAAIIDNIIPFFRSAKNSMVVIAHTQKQAGV